MKRSRTPAEKQKSLKPKTMIMKTPRTPAEKRKSRTRLVQSLAVKTPKPNNSSSARSIRQTSVINPPLRSVATSAARAGL